MATWVVTSWSGLKARTGPGTTFPVAQHGGKPVVRPFGYRVQVRKTKTVRGQKWGQAAEFWYCLAYCSKPGQASSGVRVASPVPGVGVGYPFGVHDSRYLAKFHTGADYPGGQGAKIVTPISGTVVRADWGGAYGNWTLIQGKVDGKVCTFAFCHQSSRTVQVGEKVTAGQMVGRVGSTGNVTGPHLHMERSRGRNWAYADVVNPVW